MVLKRIIIGLVAPVVLGVVAITALAWSLAIAPIHRPLPGSFAPADVARGAILASVGNCATCHTSRHGAPLAGGLAIRTSFGIIYSTNITPDPATGIV